MLPVILLLDTKEESSRAWKNSILKTQQKLREISEITREQEDNIHKGTGVPFHISSFESFTALKCLEFPTEFLHQHLRKAPSCF